jgi:hypothetical protein
MKRFLSVAFAVLMIAGLSSCKKDYSCTCTWTQQGTSMSQDYPYGKQTKGDAKEACDDQEAIWKALDPDASCELK